MCNTRRRRHCISDSLLEAIGICCCVESVLCSVGPSLSGAKEECLAAPGNEFKILETEHREHLVKARSNKQIKSLSAGLSKGNTCKSEVMKDTPGVACVLPDAGDTVFQIHCLERSAYASVLRSFCVVTNHLSWLQVKLLTKLRNELRISHVEHKEVLVKVGSNEHIKSLRNFSLANFSVLKKMNPAFDAHAVVHDKVGSTGSTSSTSCLSLAQQSPISERLIVFPSHKSSVF
uniref:ENT domain-containing protein n=1 Tax=Arundo donax TaxID=35708 RepID=A0A0A9DD76_ARUDO